MSRLVERIHQFHARKGRKPRLILLSMVEETALKIDLAMVDGPANNLMGVELDEFYGVKCVRATDVLLPEEL